MDTDRAQRELENSGSWQLVDGRWLWWNGKRYTTEWNGTSYVPLSGTNAKTANVGMVLFLITAVLLWTPGAITGPVPPPARSPACVSARICPDRFGASVSRLCGRPIAYSSANSRASFSVTNSGGSLNTIVPAKAPAAS